MSALHDHSISIHRSLAGPDKTRLFSDFFPQDFNPQVPCGTRQNPASLQVTEPEFQSTGPLRDPTPRRTVLFHPCSISIHRSLAGPDDLVIPFELHRHRISIHRSLAGPDASNTASSLSSMSFQSTGPLRDPTGRAPSPRSCIPISIHRSLAGPDGEEIDGTRGYIISIHRSLAGPDAEDFAALIAFAKFQSTGPLRDPTTASRNRAG